MKSRSSWLITIGLAAVSVGYLYFAFLPARRSIEKVRTELGQKRAHLAKEPGLKVSLAAAEANLADAQKFVQDWRRACPAAGELSTTYGQIHRIAKKSGVQVEKFDPRPVANLETIRRIPITMTAEGSFAQLHELLRGLEQMPTSLWLEGLRIERGKDAEAPLKGEVTLVIFAANPDISD